jgi:hypothetical protein
MPASRCCVSHNVVSEGLTAGARRFDFDSRDEFVRRDGGVHGREVSVRRGKESASGGHDGTPGRRSARESKGGLAAAV